LKFSGARHRGWGSGAVTAALLAFLASTGVAFADEEAARLLEAEHQVTRILSDAGDPAFGAYLGGECATCHQQSGNSDGIPPIAGLPADYTVQALVEYRLGIRTNEVMQLMAKRLADEEIAALAAYFAQEEAQ
jgi:cytochrome c553